MKLYNSESRTIEEFKPKNAKKQKDYIEADAIRKELLDSGIELLNTK